MNILSIVFLPRDSDFKKTPSNASDRGYRLKMFDLRLARIDFLLAIARKFLRIKRQ